MRSAGKTLVLGALLLSGVVGFAEPPKELGLVERAERTLVQLIVRVRARSPQERAAAAHLTKEDFSVVLDQTELPRAQFELDNFCPAPDEVLPVEAEPPQKHLLFFTDELAPEGQDNTKAMLQQMIPRMAADGYQMKILPRFGGDWTRDTGRLLHEAEALFDFEPSFEDGDFSNETGIRALMSDNRVDEAIALAREAEVASQLTFEGPALQLTRALSEMSALPMPKALIYFADFPLSFREMIMDTAIRSGVAVYAVKADGMAPYDPSVKTVNDPGSIITMSMSGLSDHTGGRFSFGGFRQTTSNRILDRVETDLSCIYVLSLDALGLDRNRLLRPKVKLRPELASRLVAETIPDLTIPSEERRQGEVVAIVLRSAGWPGVQPAAVSFVPSAIDKSRVAGSIRFLWEPGRDGRALPTPWDVGVNYFGGDRFSGFGSARVTSPASKVIFEEKVKIPFGPYSIVGVAQEVGGRALARGTAVGIISRPKRNAVGFLHPVDVVQREPGVGSAPLRYGMAVSGRPLAIVTSVCRGAGVRGTLTVEKSLRRMDTEQRLPSTSWPAQEALCRVITDETGPNQLPWSNRPYEATLVVSVKDASGRSLARDARAFWVVDASATSAVPASGP